MNVVGDILNDMTITLDSVLREMLREVVRDEVSAALREFKETQSAAPVRSQEEKYLTAPQAAELAGVSPATVRSWAQRGELLSCYAGRLLRIKDSDLRAYLERPRKASSERSPHDDDAMVDEILREEASRCVGCGHLQKLHQGIQCSARNCKCKCWTQK